LNRSDLLFDLIAAQRQLNEAASGTVSGTVSVRDSAPRVPQRRPIAERLSEVDVQALVAAFVAGTPKWKLAQRYGIGMTSVKRLLKERGATKQGH
jgi:hypothetical protein